MSARGVGGLAGLAVILGATVAWWALALVPLESSAPEWVLRTRQVCFGAGPSSLPHAGGWLLLVGEPLGMLAALLVGWRDAVREGLAGLVRARWGRVALGAVLLGLAVGGSAALARVAAAAGVRFDLQGGDDPAAIVAAGRMDRAAPRLDLGDQHGTLVRTEEFRGRPWLVTFAYAHCTTVCPAIVRDLLEARRRLGSDAPPLVIVTLDPWRDTPSRLPTIADAWGLDEGTRVLSGEVEKVELVLSAWQVPRSRNPSTGDLIHPGIAYVVSSTGRITHMVDGSVGATLMALGR